MANESRTRDGRPARKGRGVGDRIIPEEEKQPRCAAFTKDSGKTKRCRNYAVKGTTVCHKHGAYMVLAQQGAAHPMYTDGRYSRKKSNSASMQAAYERFLGETDPFSHRDEIAMLSAILEDEWSHVGQDAGALTALWTEANEHMKEFERALMARDMEAQQTAFLDLRDTVRKGMRDAEARNNVRRLAQERANLADKETRRIVSLKNVMTADQARALFERMIYEINKNVTDMDDRRRLNSALIRLGGGLEEKAIESHEDEARRMAELQAD